MNTDLFNFISDEAFRTSLEADYHELELCMKAGAWKAVHVLAGSIVETLLLDYLVVTEYDKRSSRKLSEIKLYELIDICKKEQVLSSKAADLASAIREYRNLIHPEKLRRLEETVDENGAVVAQALIRMVIDGISTRRSQQVGLTAEQLVAKIERDTSATSILVHLLKNVREIEMRRLLMDKLPKRYIYLQNPESPLRSEVQKANILAAFESCYRTVFDVSSTETKEAVVKEFVRVLREESQQTVSLYEEVFFRGQDLEYFSPEDQQMFKHHFLSEISKKINHKLIAAASGIGKFLTSEDVPSFVDGFMRGMAYDQAIINEKAQVDFFLEFNNMSERIQDETIKRVKDWIYTLKKSEKEFPLKMAEGVLEEAKSLLELRFLPDFPDEEESPDEEEYADI